MTEVIEAIVLGIIQGLTEFIPVSSSGHLIIAHRVFGSVEGSLAFDLALHLGTLGALTSFFWRDIAGLLRGLFRKGHSNRLSWLVALATIPAVLAGMVLQDLAADSFRSTILVGANLMIVGLVMLVAEQYSASRKRFALDKLTSSGAAIIGLSQALALVPGVSRSGSTITAGLFVGLDRTSAARFSFLLAIPITAGACLKVLLSDGAPSTANSSLAVLIAGIAASLISGLIAIRFLLLFLSKHSLRPFAVYRIILGLIVLFLFR
jgi:undecaprenyl-diphosphatase